MTEGDLEKCDWHCLEVSLFTCGHLGWNHSRLMHGHCFQNTSRSPLHKAWDSHNIVAGFPEKVSGEWTSWENPGNCIVPQGTHGASLMLHFLCSKEPLGQPKWKGIDRERFFWGKAYSENTINHSISQYCPSSVGPHLDLMCFTIWTKTFLPQLKLLSLTKPESCHRAHTYYMI